jgi:hypothetical protein
MLGDMRILRNLQAWHRQRVENDIFDVSGAGAPTSGTSGTGLNLCGPGSTYRDITNGTFYFNVNTKASPQWVLATPAASGNGGDMFLRSRQTIAAINAGATLLPAIPGMKYRINDVSMIAIGGAAAGATLVRVLGTQAAGSVVINSATVGILTQSAMVRAGIANSVILADGASFVANDVNTAITCDKTGASLTTSTHIDFLISYSLER